MTPQELKNSILQLAIQGKLVEQRPEEGTAEELFARIQEEKQRLIAEKKIKKEKSLSEIMEDEKPFDIPESWKWVRIGHVFGLQAGKNITSANIYEEKSEQNPYQCFGGNGVRGFVSTYNRQGYFALIGRQGALCGNINLAHGKFYATEHAVVVDHYNITDVLWCGWFLKALNLNQYATATAQPGLAVANIVKVLIPLPPLAEQKRIVAKIEELLPYIDRYGQAWSKLEQFNSRFPEDMKKSLLQYAIQGKLVEQRPEEGTAEELFAQIQEEKQRLVAEKKIKKEKPLPEITEDEKPFDIPESWKWVRFSDLMNAMSTGPFGSMLHKSDYISDGIPLVNPANIVRGKIIPSEKMMVSTDTAKRLESYTLHTGMIVIGRRGEMGRCAIVGENEDGWICGTGSFFLTPSPYLFVDYIQIFFSTHYAKVYLGGESVGTTMSNLNHKILSKMPIPLPPLAEQKRIVEKLEQLLPLCERLK